MAVLYVSNSGTIEDSLDADDQRDLSLDSGGVDPHRPAVRVRPPDGLRPALLVVRYALRIPRGPEDERRSGGLGRRRLRVSGRRDHRRRAAASARRLSADARAPRPRPHGAARNGRPSQRRRRAAGGHPHHRREVSGERRVREERLVEPGSADANRRGQVRRAGSAGLRVRERRDRGGTRSRAGAPRF